MLKKLILMVIVIAIGSVQSQAISGQFLGIDYDFECAQDLMDNLFTNYFLKNLQLCLADAGWRAANPYVKQWVRAKSNEVFADVADDVSQIGQPFTHTADEVYNESILVVKT